LGISILAGPGFSVDDSFLVVGVPPGRHPEKLDALELFSDYLLRSCSVSSRGSSHPEGLGQSRQPECIFPVEASLVLFSLPA
jgi:hypothetical protein